MFSLSVLTPEKVAFEGQVYSLIVPGADGYLEILAHHAPIMSLIQPGKLTITNKNHEKIAYAVSTGFLEVSQNQANVLLDAIELVSEIDIKRARSAYERARNRIDSKEKDVDLDRAKKDLQRAENRIKLYQENQSIDNNLNKPIY